MVGRLDSRKRFDVDRLRGNDWRVNQLLYVDVTVLLGDSKENIQRLLSIWMEVARGAFAILGKCAVICC